MAEDRRFHHPLPFGLLILLIAACQALAFGVRALAFHLFGLPSPGWLAAGLGGVFAIGAVELSARVLRRTR